MADKFVIFDTRRSRSRHALAFRTCIVAAGGFAAPAWANVGIPFLAWPALWLILFIVPVVAIEAWVLRRRIALTIGRAAWIASISNIVSTVVGVVLLMILSFVLDGNLPQGKTADVMTLIAFVPLLYLSVSIEAAYSRWRLKELPRVVVNRAVLVANVASYTLLFAFVLLRLGLHEAELPCRLPLLQGCYSDFHRAVTDGNLREAKRIVRSGEGLSLESAWGYLGETALHSACMYGDVELVRLLLERGADTRARIKYGETPLHVAARRNADILRLLLENGADVEARANNGATALHEAADAGYAKSVAALIEKGADPNAVDNYGKTPLHAQATGRNAEVVKLLLAGGADIKARDKAGQTPLHWAALVSGNADAIRLLIAAGADVNARDNNGRTPLDIATRPELVANARPRFAEAVKLLLDNGAKKGADM